MSTLDQAINGLNKVQSDKMKAARQTTSQVSNYAVDVAKSEGWTRPNGATSPGDYPDRAA